MLGRRLPASGFIAAALFEVLCEEVPYVLASLAARLAYKGTIRAFTPAERVTSRSGYRSKNKNQTYGRRT